MDDSGYTRHWTGLHVPTSRLGSEEPDLSPLTPEQHAIILDGLATFRANPDVIRIWEFNRWHGDLQGLQLPEGASQVANTPCWIVCPFVNGRLLLHSPGALRAGKFMLRVSHSVLFDSNMYNDIVVFAEHPGRMKTTACEQAFKLISMIVSYGYDFQMLPYLLEAYTKSSKPEEYALRVVLALLRLHTMDREHFRATGNIHLDPAIVSSYEREYGTTNLNEIASTQVLGYADVSGTVPPQVDVAMLVLLKMVTIRRFELVGKSFDLQFAAFDDYVFQTFGGVLMRLRSVATMYFSGTLDGWIRVQPGMSAHKASESLSNCAWDLFLGDVPIMLLGECDETEAILAHFCTRERGLAKLLATWQLRCLTVRTNRRYDTFFEYDPQLFLEVLGNEAKARLDAINRRAVEFAENRVEGHFKTARPWAVQNRTLQAE